MDKELGKQWKKLCDDFETAKADYLQAQGKLTRKFAAIAKRQGQSNPSMTVI